jgi:glyoxylase-like metal-dependent hydrolase (beta-lactamase superfamily II)
MKPEVTAFFHQQTFTVTYLVKDPDSNHCAIIDSVLDFDASSGRTSTTTADDLIYHIRDKELIVDWILETHVHADHLSAAPYLQAALGGKTGIGSNVPIVQDVFAQIFNTETDFKADGSQFDHLFSDGEEVVLGHGVFTVWSTPGHTPACVSYVFDDAIFVGDTLFMPDFGTARTDFPGGDAELLYKSIKLMFSLPQATRIFTCHDYAPNGREYIWESSVAEQSRDNIHIGGDVSEEAFVKMRTERDAKLSMPDLILPSVQVNMRAGQLPPKEDNGVRYLKIPLDRL